MHFAGRFRKDGRWTAGEFTAADGGTGEPEIEAALEDHCERNAIMRMRFEDRAGREARPCEAEASGFGCEVDFAAHLHGNLRNAFGRHASLLSSVSP
jgi:hypothetical protein